MLAFLKEWIINIVTISIILILFEIIIPTGKIKKIINLVSGFILLIVIINPFIALKNQNYNLSKNVISDSFYIDKKEMENSSKLLNETQIKQISKVYKDKLTKKIESETENIDGAKASKINIEINEDYKSDKFGEINKVYIEMEKVKKESKEQQDQGDIDIKPVISIKAVDITTQISDSDKKKTPTKQISQSSSKITETVKENINKTLEIPKDCIVVIVNEE